MALRHSAVCLVLAARVLRFLLLFCRLRLKLVRQLDHVRLRYPYAVIAGIVAIV